MTKQELHMACARRFPRIFYQIILQLVCAQCNGIVLCAHAPHLPRSMGKTRPQALPAPSCDEIYLHFRLDFADPSTHVSLRVACPRFLLSTQNNVETLAGRLLRAAGGGGAPKVGDHVGIAHVHKRYSKRKAHKVVEVRRVIPRLDDENALPPLEKKEQPQLA